MNKVEFEKFIQNIENNFYYLLQSNFKLKSQYISSRDCEVTLTSDNCKLSFIEDNDEVFLFLESTSFDTQREHLRFEIEVIIAFLTNLRKIVRGPNRVTSNISDQVKMLAEIFMLFQDEILNLFIPNHYPDAETSLKKTKKEVDLIYINYIKNK